MAKEIGQTTIYEILHRPLKIEQQVPYKPRVNSGAPEGLPFPVTPVVLLWKPCWIPVYVNKYK